MNIQVKSVDSTHAECVARIKKKYADIKGLERFNPFFMCVLCLQGLINIYLHRLKYILTLLLKNTVDN